MLQHRNNDNNLTLGTVRLVLGIIAIALSLIFSIQFVAAGSTGGMIIGAILFCLVTEFCKTVFTGDLFYYWETGQSSKVLFSSLIVLVLFALSISAAVFVLSISPAKQNAEIANFQERRAVLEKNVEDKKAELARCKPTHLTRCVTPRTVELTQLQTELNTFLEQADNRKLIEAQSNKEFWQKAANYLGSDPDSLQLNFAIARAVLLDLLGLILVSQYTASKRLNNVIQGVYSNEKQAGHGQVPSDNAAEVFALMSAKIEALEKQLEKKQ
jgi:hypothetical protein